MCVVLDPGSLGRDDQTVSGKALLIFQVQTCLVEEEGLSGTVRAMAWKGLGSEIR